MSPRVRLLIVIALVVVLIGVAAALLLPQLTQTGGGAPTQASVVVTGEGGATRVVQALPTPTPIPVVQIVVAVQQINRGTVITPDLVALYEWPEEYAPINAITSVETVIGKIARTDIFREQPILQTIITENLSQLGATGSDAGALLPQGSRMIAVPIDRLTSIGYALQPGDRVDMVISLLFVELDREFQARLPNLVRIIDEDAEGNITVLAPIEGRRESIPFIGGTRDALIGPREQYRPRLSTQMIIQDALVVYMGNFPPDGRILRIGATPLPAPVAEPTVDPAAARRGEPTALPTAIPRPDLVSLAVSPQEAVVLTYLIEAGVPVNFLLRPATETGRASVNPVTLDYIMTTYGIQLPATRDYGIEPAIRSIRRLVVGDTISLGSASGDAAPAAP